MEPLLEHSLLLVSIAGVPSPQPKHEEQWYASMLTGLQGQADLQQISLTAGKPEQSREISTYAASWEMGHNHKEFLGIMSVL